MSPPPRKVHIMSCQEPGRSSDTALKSGYNLLLRSYRSSALSHPPVRPGLPATYPWLLSPPSFVNSSSLSFHSPKRPPKRQQPPPCQSAESVSFLIRSYNTKRFLSIIFYILYCKFYYWDSPLPTFHTRFCTGQTSYSVCPA